MDDETTRVLSEWRESLATTPPQQWPHFHRQISLSDLARVIAALEAR